MTILTENMARKARIASANYDPLTGSPTAGWRTAVRRKGVMHYLPDAMVSDPHYSEALTDTEWERLRIRHDFEYWAARCVKITDKLTGAEVPFILNRPQRRLVETLEAQRRRGEPLRVIVLKARQWGASTLVQIYCAWIQIVLARNWHSLICAHVKDTSSTVRGMMARLLENYPKELWDEEEAPQLRPFERTQNTRVIAGRGSKLTVCSAENQDSVRGQDISLAHLSEVAFWRDTPQHSPTDLMRSLAGGIASKPLSLIVMESTANGVGNYFHREWERATGPGGSDKEPFFVAWHEIDIYRERVADPEAFFETLDDYERELWERHGCTLEAIAWYKRRRREYATHRDLMAEFPTTPEEAFSTSGSGVFDNADLERLEEGCEEGERGEGESRLWRRPEEGGRYMAVVDIGGRKAGEARSVVAVMRTDGPRPEVVAQWAGHSDYDHLARRAEAMGRHYNDARLVVATFDREPQSEGRGLYILDLLKGNYPNLYRKHGKEGLHVSPAMKNAMVCHLTAMVRDGAYRERSAEAVEELRHYEQLPDGSEAARPGCRDDLLVTRAVGLWVAREEARSVRPGRKYLRDYALASMPTLRLW
ncbi:MAG: hypothetical protein K2G35_09675 [Duncaniella sp.]|nr:hypothetical protein [Duncaniella sp.]